MRMDRWPREDKFWPREDKLRKGVVPAVPEVRKEPPVLMIVALCNLAFRRRATSLNSTVALAFDESQRQNGASHGCPIGRIVPLIPLAASRQHPCSSNHLHLHQFDSVLRPSLHFHFVIFFFTSLFSSRFPPSLPLRSLSNSPTLFPKAGALFCFVFRLACRDRLSLPPLRLCLLCSSSRLSSNFTSRLPSRNQPLSESA